MIGLRTDSLPKYIFLKRVRGRRGGGGERGARTWTDLA